MERPSLWILTVEHWRSVAAAQSRNLAGGWAGEAHVVCLGSGGAEVEPTSTVLEPLLLAWSSLRSATGLPTRYNSPTRTLRALYRFDPRRDHCAPYVVLGRLGGAHLLLVGEIAVRPLLGVLGPVGEHGPRRPTLEVPETAAVARAGDDPEELTALAGAMVGSLLGDGAVDALRLLNLEADSELARSCRGASETRPRSLVVPKIRWWAQLTDPVTGDRLDKPTKNSRRQDNKLVRAFDGDVSFEVVTEVGQVDRFVAEASSIVAQTYQAAIGIGVRDDPAYRDLLVEMAEARALRGFVLRGQGEPIGYVLGDRWGDSFSLWALSFLPGYGHLSPGTVAMRRAMSSLADEGVARIDFGWGDAEYKRRFGDQRVDEIDLALYPRRVLPTVAFAVAWAVRMAGAAVETACTRLGVRDRVRTLRRSLRRHGEVGRQPVPTASRPDPATGHEGAARPAGRVPAAR